MRGEAESTITHRNQERIVQLFQGKSTSTLVPEVFLIFHRISRSCKRAAKQRTQVAKQQERKTSGYFGLESHFHAEDRVGI